MSTMAEGSKLQRRND